MFFFEENRGPLLPSEYIKNSSTEVTKVTWVLTKEKKAGPYQRLT
jgi:hypothetical protein